MIQAALGSTLVFLSRSILGMNLLFQVKSSRASQDLSKNAIKRYVFHHPLTSHVVCASDDVGSEWESMSDPRGTNCITSDS